MTSSSKIQKGCGYAIGYSTHNLCKEGNLCDDCEHDLKIFNDGVEEGKKQMSDKIKCKYCPMCGLKFEECYCGEYAFNVVWLRKKLQEEQQ